MIEKLKEYWDGLSEREHKLVVVAGGVLAALLYYAIIWEPLHQSVMRMRNDITANQELLVWMKASQEKIKRAKTRKKNNAQTMSLGDQSLLSLTEKLVQQQSLSGSVKEIKQADDNKVQINFDEVVYSKLIKWLDTLTQRYDVGIESVNIKRTKIAGTVNASVLLVE